MAGDRKVSSWRGWPPRVLLMDNNRDISPHLGGSLPGNSMTTSVSISRLLNTTISVLTLVQFCVMHHIGVVVR